VALDIPQVWFGPVDEKRNVEKVPDDSPDDDTELLHTPKYVIGMLGFDPAKVESPLLKVGKRYVKPVRFQEYITDQKVEAIAAIVRKALDQARTATIKAVYQHLAKADPDPHEEARRIVVSLHLQDELHAIVQIEAILRDTGATAGAEAIRHVLEAAGAPPPPDDIFHVIDQRMVQYARARAAEMIGMHRNADGTLSPARRASYRIDESTRNMLNQSLSSAFEAGLTAHEIQQGLMQDYAFSPARALNIARTESAFAFARGAMIGYRQGKEKYDLPMQKTWLLGEDPCEICQANADQGPIDLDDEFDSGDDAPPAHPSCRCDIGTIIGDQETDEDPDEAEEDE
jgi:Phage Mu protein F like protein